MLLLSAWSGSVKFKHMLHSYTLSQLIVRFLFISQINIATLRYFSAVNYLSFVVMCFFSASSIHIICWGALHIKQIVRAIVWKERTPKIAKMIQRDSRLRRVRYNTNVATCTYKHNGIVCMLGQKAKHRSKSIPIVLTALFFLVDHLYNVT